MSSLVKQEVEVTIRSAEAWLVKAKECLVKGEEFKTRMALREAERECYIARDTMLKYATPGQRVDITIGAIL